MSLWQSLCFWSVITVIYSCGFSLKGFPLSFPERNLRLFCSRFGVPIFSFVAADYWDWLFYFTCCRKFSVSVKLISEELMLLSKRLDNNTFFFSNYKPHIFHNIFKSQKCELRVLIWSYVALFSCLSWIYFLLPNKLHGLLIMILWWEERVWWPKNDSFILRNSSWTATMSLELFRFDCVGLVFIGTLVNTGWVVSKCPCSFMPFLISLLIQFSIFFLSAPKVITYFGIEDVFYRLCWKWHLVVCWKVELCY